MSITDFLIQLGINTLTQLVSLFGVFFLFGFVLYFLARFTRKTYVKTVGYKFDVFFTGWLGTPVHELGHAIFCLIFFHSISEIKLYAPNAKDGMLGYVNHVYNKKNIYQKIGNFFIGIGPILFGSFVLFLLLYFLLSDQKVLSAVYKGECFSITSWQDAKDQLLSIGKMGVDMIKLLFTGVNFHSGVFLIFLYLSICIASHMELSPSDLKGAWFGLLSIVIVILAINGIALVAGFDFTHYVRLLNKQMGILTGIFIFAFIISAFNFLVSFFVLSIVSLLRKKGFVNPFWG